MGESSVYSSGMRTATGVGLALLVVGCSKAGNGKEPAPKEPATEAARPGPPAAPADAPPVFVLANEGGVFGLDATGAAVKQYSKTPASSPRFIPGTTDVVFFRDDDRSLHRLALDTGKETQVAAIPEPAACGSDLGLRVQSDWDFAIDAGGKRACLRLYDRNENMADVGVVARVDLTTGKVESAVALGLDCPADDKADDLFDCQRTPPRKRPTHPAIDAAKMPEGFEAEARSPSGKWAVIAGNMSEGDYIHRDALLLEVATGKVFPLVEGPWPAPLERAAVEAFEYETADVVGESTIEWIGTAGDLLRVDRLLVTPGTSIAGVDGDLVERL